jgi:hypothetical protein
MARIPFERVGGLPISAELELWAQETCLYSRAEVLVKPSPVPSKQGIYAWYFREIPGQVPDKGCLTRDGLTLLYVGISPKGPSSSQNLRKRIRYHYRGNAYGSTLRFTLGVLLESASGYPLRCVGTGNRMTFTHQGEQWLDEWMERNAWVCWMEHQRPWEIEAELIGQLRLPLNIRDNGLHEFVPLLSSIRKAARTRAMDMPTVNELGGRRQTVGHPLV